MIKCIVWDLDQTLWEGILLEDKAVTLNTGVLEVIQILDQRGILHSIASKNEPEMAMKKLDEFGVADFFLYPQISWQPKSQSIQAIASALNIGLDAMAFVDDQPFERSEVSYALPQVRCYDTSLVVKFPSLLEMTPEKITPESSKRRRMYQDEARRMEAEKTFEGTNEAFLTSLEMELDIHPARKDELARVEELTIRTHQLNSTGVTYSYHELDIFRCSRQHLLLIAGLEDKFGDYGKIGLALVECLPHEWTIKLLLMSCRVASRGIGTILVNEIMRRAKISGSRLFAEFLPTTRNRIMLVTYTFAGFREISREGDKILLENSMDHIQQPPAYIRLIIEDSVPGVNT